MIVRTYHGERTERGCVVTVDGRPLRPRPDLSGPESASGSGTTAFEWGDAGGVQLSLALLADFLGDDARARGLYEAFEREVVDHLPHDSWTLTDHEVAIALAPSGWCGCWPCADSHGHALPPETSWG